MSELPKFRRIEDVNRFLEDLAEEIKVSDQLVRRQHELLSKLTRPTPRIRELLGAIAEFDVSPSKASELRKLKRKVDPALTEFVIPNLEKLKSQYGLLEDLYAKHSTLNAVSTQIAMQFPDRRGELYDKALGSITALKSKVEDQLRTVFDFLSSVAARHVPEEFQAYVSAVHEKIADHVYYEDSSRYLYVSTREEPAPGNLTHSVIVFTEYLLLTDSVSDDGKVAPQLYVVVQWEVGGTTTIHVEHEFTLPNQLTGGDVVSNVQEAVAAVAHALDLEGFSSYLGTLPMSLQLSITPEQLKPSLFQYKNYIDTVKVDPELVTFVFKSVSIKEDVKKKIAYQLFQELKSLLKTKKAKLRMKLTKPQVEFSLLNIAEEGEISTHDLAFFKTKLGLTDQALAKISRIINNDRA